MVTLGGYIVAIFITLGYKHPLQCGPLCICCPGCSKDVLSFQLTPGFAHLSRHTPEAIPLITRFALTCEGAWCVVAEGIRVTSAVLAFIYVSAGSAISREARQTGAGVGGATHIDALGSLGDITVVEGSFTVVDGTLVLSSYTYSPV